MNSMAPRLLAFALGVVVVLFLVRRLWPHLYRIGLTARPMGGGYLFVSTIEPR